MDSPSVPIAVPASDALEAPRARGPLSALRCVAFLAAHPRARPGSSRLDRALFGAAQVIWSIRMLAGDRALRRAAIRPTLLSLLACAGIALVLSWGDEVSGLAYLRQLAATFVTLAAMPPTVLHREWVRLALEARLAAGLDPGHDEDAALSFSAVVWKEAKKAIRQLVVVTAGLFPLVLLLRFFPAGRTAGAVLVGLWGLYWVVLDSLELPFGVQPIRRAPARAAWFVRFFWAVGQQIPIARPVRWFGRRLKRLTRPWRREVDFTERHGAEMLGFGIAVALVLAVPVLGLVFRAVAITAATNLVSRVGPRRSPPG
jgi:uncharacterized protein involved in cysteine biosynthesis